MERRTKIPGANTCRRFHGTIRACRLGDTSSDGALCKLSICNICSIIRVQLMLVSISFIVLTHSFYRAPSSLPTWGNAQTSAGLEQVSIRLRRRRRSVCFICRGKHQDSGILYRPTTTTLGVRLRIGQCFSTMLCWAKQSSLPRQMKVSQRCGV